MFNAKMMPSLKHFFLIFSLHCEAFMRVGVGHFCTRWIIEKPGGLIHVDFLLDSQLTNLKKDGPIEYLASALKTMQKTAASGTFRQIVPLLPIMTACLIGSRGDVEWRVSASETIRASIEALWASQKTLEDVVRWGLLQQPLQMIRDVVVQDEYTHDIILQHPSGHWLVYDTT
jgi:hypothetical protein